MKEAVLLQERRLEVRFNLNGLIPLSLISGNGRVLTAIFVDVSRRGLGLIIEPSLRVDEEITLKIAGSKDVPMSVRWVKKPLGVTAPGVPSFHRTGICIDTTKISGTLDLTRVLEQFNCVDF
ncbi:MAG: PilZ domain-containing protein [Pseudobacteriovorax sp.]|nr:PilZ domain-containing protein [Pseudobacteriovorax sp.]